MKEFDVLKQIYKKDYFKNRFAIGQGAELINIPNTNGYGKMKIMACLSDPTSNEELGFALSFVDLCKIIYDNVSLLRDTNIFSPFNTTAYKYIEKAVDLELDTIYNPEREYDENSTLIEIDVKSKLHELASNIVSENNMTYDEFLIELNLIVRMFYNEIIDNIVQKKSKEEIRKIFSSPIGVNVNEFTAQNVIKSLVNSYETIILGEQISVDGQKSEDIDYKKLAIYMTKFKKYIINNVIRKRIK